MEVVGTLLPIFKPYLANLDNSKLKWEETIPYYAEKLGKDCSLTLVFKYSIN